MTRWICIKDCRVLGQNFKKDNLVEYATNPNSACFEAYPGDEILLVTNTPRTDRDGTLYFGATGWDDFAAPATRAKQGQTDKPDFDFTRMGLLFPQNDPDEKIYVMDQIPHRWKVGSPIRPHVHWLQESTDLPVWKMDYRIMNVNEVDDGVFTSVTCKTTTLFPYTSGNMRQITEFPPINMTGYTPSAQFEFIMYRDDNVVSGDVLFKTFDFHYQIDSIGSGREYDK